MIKMRKQFDMKIIDFTQKPATILPYNFGDEITRENFVNFLIVSYAVSKEDIVIHRLFFVLQERKFGFDYPKAIEDLHKSGGWKIFTKEEQKMFIEYFSKQMKGLDKEEVEEEVIYEIKILYPTMTERGWLFWLKSKEAERAFEKINSVDDFVKFVEEFEEDIN